MHRKGAATALLRIAAVAIGQQIVCFKSGQTVSALSASRKLVISNPR